MIIHNISSSILKLNEEEINFLYMFSSSLLKEWGNQMLHDFSNTPHCRNCHVVDDHVFRSKLYSLDCDSIAAIPINYGIHVKFWASASQKNWLEMVCDPTKIKFIIPGSEAFLKVKLIQYQRVKRFLETGNWRDKIPSLNLKPIQEKPIDPYSLTKEDRVALYKKNIQEVFGK